MPTFVAEGAQRGEAVPHYVGRDAELSRVQALLREAVLGSGAALIVAGEEGSGKSRLLRECAALHSSGLKLAVRCGEVPGHDAAAQLLDGLGAGRSRPARTGATLPVLLTDACRRRPVAVFVDDLHLAKATDLRALATLFSLVRRLRLVVVATYTPGLDGMRTEYRIRRWVADGATQLHLAPLRDSDVLLLVRSSVGNAAPTLESQNLRALLHAAQGNPGTVLELARQATTAVVDGTPLVAPSACAKLTTLRETLSRATFEVLILCSVIGDTFCDAWIVALAQADRGTVADALQELSDHGILVEEPGRAGWFGFRHVALRQALYVSIVSLKRRVLHERAAAYLSALDADASDAQHATLVAHHWHVLEDHDRAARWLLIAADDFAARGDFAAAAERYARAGGHLPGGSPQWLDVQASLCRCYRNLAEWQHVINVASGMLATVDRAADPRISDNLFSDLFYGHLNNGDRDAARAVAEELGALDRHAPPDRSTVATLVLAYALCYAGRREDARAIVQRVHPHAVAGGEPRLRYLVALATIDAIHEPLHRSLRLVDEAAGIAKGLGIRGTAHCYGVGVEIALMYGDVAAAHEYLAKAAATAARSAGDTNDVKRFVATESIRVALIAGDLATAHDLTIRCLEWRDAGRYTESFLAGAGTLVGMRTGDSALVDALFDPRLLAAAVAAGDAESCGILLPGYAEVMQARGMSRELRAILQRCAEQALVDPYIWIPQCVVRYGSPEHADAAATHAERFLAGAIAPAAAAHTAYFAALMARRHGKHIAACEAARQAADGYRRTGWQLFEAAALETAGDRAGASDVYARCGATFEVARLASGASRKLRRAPFGARLTAREQEVARFVARKWSNMEIARALEISVRTVHHHVEAAFNKLGIQARWQLTDELLAGYARRPEERRPPRQNRRDDSAPT